MLGSMWGGGKGKVGEGASRSSIDSTARLVDRRRQAKVTRFMSEVSVVGKGGRGDVRCLL